MKIFHPLLMALLITSTQVWSEEDVQLYETAPSAEELARKLTHSTTDAEIGSSAKKPRTRAIVFDDGGSTSSAPPAKEKQTSSAQESSGGGKVLAFPISFPPNSASITTPAIPFIESVANLMKMNTSLRFQVEGHTDAKGNSSKNLELSRKRAVSVTNHLINQYSIESSRLVPVGKGSAEPLKGMNPQDPKNRRVQFRTLG